ncbi:MAG: hypothetical protein KA362_17530, partial [Chloroflexi bacterium]|nr:hypothetical protein [Chloroflexota bacterium]
MKTYLLLLLMLLLAACGSDRTAEETAVPPTASSSTTETAPDGAAPPPGYEGQTWADIVAEASGQTVNFYMWGGSDLINTWVTGYVATAVRDQYNITLNMVPISDATE